MQEFEKSEKTETSTCTRVTILACYFNSAQKKSTSKNCNSLNNGQGVVAVELGEKLNGWSDVLVGAKPKIEKKKELHQAVSRIKHAVLPNHCWRIFGWQFRCALKLSSQCTQDQVVARERQCDLAVFFPRAHLPCTTILRGVLYLQELLQRRKLNLLLKGVCKDYNGCK